LIIENYGGVVIAFGGLFGSILLYPIAYFVIKTGELTTIAQVVYAEMALFSLIGRVIVAFRQSDTANGIVGGVVVAAAVMVSEYLSYNLPAQQKIDLGGNPHYTHNIGVLLSLIFCLGGYLETNNLRK
jgi:hypothetical protein